LQPPYGFFRQMAQVAVGNLWGWTVQLAIPEEDVFGVSLSFLEILIPFAIALGYYLLPSFLLSQLQHLRNFLFIQEFTQWEM